MSAQCTTLHQHLSNELGKVMIGMEDVIHGLSIALIAGGHVLLDGPPGLGKTRISRSFAEIIGGTFSRIQGTADLMPSDLTGVHVFNASNQKFEFQQGPLFANVVLVDEINRAGPKTQSALLEAMEERQVSIDRESFLLPDDFVVIATQNPLEFEGTFPLPESQLDRFALCIAVQYLSKEQEAQVLTAYSLPQTGRVDLTKLAKVPEGILASARQEIADIHMSEALVSYVTDIAHATRDSSHTTLGLSVRGALMLCRCAKIEAALRGADFVIPDDVIRLIPWIIPHRISMNAEAAIEGVTSLDEVNRIIAHIEVPK